MEFVLFGIIIGIGMFITAIVMPLVNRSSVNQLNRQIDRMGSVITRLDLQVSELTRRLDAESDAQPETSSPPIESDPADALQSDEEPGLEPDHSDPDGETVETDGSAESQESHEEPEREPEQAAAFAQPETSEESRPQQNWLDLEQTIGAKWSVLLGGLAIALGAIFLVRYSIEAGLLGPAQRIVAGFLLSGGLFAGGEWLRRRDLSQQFPVFEKADIPGILTGVGCIAAFATIYTGYAVYGFFNPALSFLGLTLVGILSLVLSSVHGPKLAALGVVGAFAVPALVSSSAPNFWALAIHILVVTGSTLAVARIRGWLWLALTGAAGGISWTALAALGPSAAGAGTFMLIGLAVIFIAALVWQVAERPSPLFDLAQDKAVLLVFSGLLVALVFQIGGNWQLPLTATVLMLATLTMAMAATWPAASGSAIVAGLMAMFGCLAIDLSFPDISNLPATMDIFEAALLPDISSYLFQAALIFLPMAAFGLYGGLNAAATAPRMAGFLATGITLSGFLILLITYLRIAPFETRPLYGFICLLSAFISVILTEIFTRKRPDDMAAPAPAAFSVGALAALALAISVSLSKSWMPLGFALLSCGIAFIHTKRPVSTLPWLSVLAAVLGGIALWFSVPFPAIEIGNTPFFNSLIILVGLPAASLLAAGEILRRISRVELQSSIVTAIGLAAAALFVALELRHWINDGEIFSGKFGFADMGVQTIAALAFALGLQITSNRTGASIFDYASLVAGVISAAVAGIGLLLVFNPLGSNEPVGDGIFNLLIPGFLIPAILSGYIGNYTRHIRPKPYPQVFALLSGLLLLAYVTATTRHAFQGTYIGLARPTTDLEFWCYSAVWLVLGAAVLALGFYLKSLPVRLAAATLVALTIIKVFLFDLGELTGVLRALSFLGLGFFLLAFGRSYQYVLGNKGGKPKPAGGEDAGD